MRILLLSMPDAFEHTAAISMRFPNGALGSLAGNVDAHHEVACADLILAQGDVGGTVARLIAERQPDVVGLSIMTFQRRTAQRVAALCRALRPGIRLVVGGYDPSLAPAVYEDPAWDVDAVVRGEGDITFRELVRRYETGVEPADVAGLAYRTASWPRAYPAAAGQCAQRRRRAAAEAHGAGPLGLHLRRPAGGRGGDLARLHLRLQLLLDHRDARPQLPRVADRAGRRRHRRRRGPRRAGGVPRRRQHHPRPPPLRAAVRGDRRRPPAEGRVPGAGDDLVDRRRRRPPGAADEARRVPLRVPRRGERPRRRPAGDERGGQERAARRRRHRRPRQRLGGRDRGAAPRRPLRGRRPHRRQPTRHPRRISRPTSPLPSATSTGPTSSTRRRTRARR